MLFAYVSFIATRVFFQQITYFYNAFLATLSPKSISIMKPYPVWRTYLALGYYIFIAILTFIGGQKLLKKWREKEKQEVVIFTLFFALLFLLCILLRLSTSAHVWSWVYYMSLRGITWAFIGLSVLLALGVESILKLNEHISQKSFLALLLIICILAAGKFSQYPLKMDNPAIVPSVTFQRYVAALWLRGETIHGSNFLVAPYTLDIEAFEASRCMAPYAYLREYFLYGTQYYKVQYDKFTGYIPFVGGFFEQYRNMSKVQVIYANGDVEIGYKK
jgi:hypothetical protein